MSKAFQQLCQLCSSNRSREDIDDDLDWMAIWQLAKRHRVVPVLSDRLKQLGILAPDDIKSRISKHNINNLHQGLQQAAELVRLTKLFGEHNIPFVAFKGIALSQLMGLELHQRHNGDIDLLLANADDLWRTDALLITQGYRRAVPHKKLALNAAQTRHFFRHGKDLTYVHTDKPINLEVHFKLFNNRYLLNEKPSEIYKNRSHINIGTSSIPVMNKADHQKYLLAHGAFSRWYRLKWVYDIPLITDSGQLFDDERFWQKAEFAGIEQMALQGAWLSYEQLGLPLSDSTKQRFNLSRATQQLVNAAKQQQLANENIRGFRSTIDLAKREFWYSWSLRKNTAYRLEQVKMHMTSYSDWWVLPLPSCLFWLYFPLRPLLWLKRQ